MITRKQLTQKLRDACDAAGSQRQWALQNDISPAHVNDVLAGNRQPGKKIVKALGYEKCNDYTKITKQK